jgi:hypothetical protein
MIIPGAYIAWQKWKEEKNQTTEKTISDKQRILNLEQQVKRLDSMLNAKTINPK